MTITTEAELLTKVAEWIYEATRVEADWSERPIVPETWIVRDEKFRTQFVDIVGKYLPLEKLPTPEEAHQSWMDSYFAMGWKYGEVRDTKAKTHPDLLPFNELSQAERDKDAIFLAFVWLAKQLLALIKDYGLEQKIQELDYAIGWCDRNDEPQFDVNGLKTRKLELESELNNQKEGKQ